MATGGGRSRRRNDARSLSSRTALGAAALLAAWSPAACGLAAGLSEIADGFEVAPERSAVSAAETAGSQAPGSVSGAPAVSSIDGRRAVLIRGTAPVRGVPPLGRNALAALYGAYRLPGAGTKTPAGSDMPAAASSSAADNTPAGASSPAAANTPAATVTSSADDTPAGGAAQAAAATAEVWYTAEPIALGAAWALTACRGLPSGWLAYESRPKADGPPAWALKAAEYWLFIRLPEDYASPCAFAAALADRFDWFRRYGDAAAELAFPALLELAP